MVDVVRGDGLTHLHKACRKAQSKSSRNQHPLTPQASHGVSSGNGGWPGCRTG